LAIARAHGVLHARCAGTGQRGDSAEITYKPPSSTATHSNRGVIAKQETNVQLADTGQAGGANALIAAVGMVELVRVEKARTTYRHPDYDSTAVSIDVVAGVGTFGRNGDSRVRQRRRSRTSRGDRTGAQHFR
jgi:adenylate cyclase class IV